MKTTYLSICLSLLFLQSTLLGQDARTTGSSKKINIEAQLKQSSKNKIDTRVDNMQYWIQKAEEGIIPFDPVIPIKPAEYKTSKISVKGVKITNSIDIPVSSLTNITESENSVFVDPSNFDILINSNNSTPYPVAGIYGANYFNSVDAGLSWGGSEQGAGGSNSGDPAVAIGLNGRHYVGYIESGLGQGISFTDDGTTWSSVIVAPNPGQVADKNHMWIDNGLTSPYEGNLYDSWTDFGGADHYEIKINHSTDDGLTWSIPQNISSAVNAGSHNQGVHIQTGPNGETYVAWAIYDGWPTDETAIGFTKSTDGGLTYQTATRIISNIRGIRTTTTSKNHRVNSFPVMAVDISGGVNNGNIYIVWTNVGTPGTNTGTNLSVYIIRSTDGGTNWSTPVRVNQGPFVAGKEAYFPWITCDPITGVLSVVFYDDRNTTSSSCEAWVSNSLDAGNTWTDFVVSDVSFTPSPIPGLAGGYMGDYLSISARGGKVYPCWTDTRNGKFMTYVSPYELGFFAQFMANENIICTSSSISFSDLTTGTPNSWEWEFPGGVPATYSGQNPPPIAYNAPGSYSISLIASDGANTDTIVKADYVIVKDIIAGFSSSPTTVVIGNTATFTDNTQCNPTSWDWSFPGGIPASYTGQFPPAVQYDNLGVYDVVLTVGNGTATETITDTASISVVLAWYDMQDGTATVCDAHFYDSGGLSDDYINNENYVMTFYPQTTGAMIQADFTLFDIEDYVNCSYDFLKIYNGENTSSPLIGTYCGINSPGTVVASNIAGALTFQFHSDPGIIGPGWEATLSCNTDPPVADFVSSTQFEAIHTDVQFSDLSSGGPSIWSWTFSPNTISFAGGTDANSQNPIIQFNEEGTYTVNLTSTNLFGNDLVTKIDYVEAVKCSYCETAYSNTTIDWINNVIFGDLENGSGPDGYADFTNVSTDVIAGDFYDVEVEIEVDAAWPLNCWIFIDWNQNCDFSDQGESYDLGTTSGAPGTYAITATIQVPVNATSGLTRMRVVERPNNEPEPCTFTNYGEAEDYSLNILGSPTLDLDLNVFLDGPFNGVSMNMDLNLDLPLEQIFNSSPWNYTGNEKVAVIPGLDIVDWLMIELRDAPSAALAFGSTKIAQQAAFLRNDGQIVDLFGKPILSFHNVISDSLFAVVSQRNHIPVMNPYGLISAGGVHQHDFSSGVDQAFGDMDAHIEIAPGVWGMAGGDGDANGQVELIDIMSVWGLGAGTSGYLPGDYNMDKQLDNKDKDDVWVQGMGMISKVPN